MKYNYYDCQIDEGVASVRLLGVSLPATEELADEFLDLMLRLQEDRAARVILFEDGERPFSFGADRELLAEQRGQDGQSEALSVDLQVARRVVTLCHEMPKPIIAAARGEVGEDGLGFFMIADVRLAAETATFTVADLGHGLLPDWGLSHTLPRQIGPGRMLELLWSGRTVTAPEGYAMGLIDRIIKSDRWTEELGDFARRVARLPQPAVHLSKLASQQFSQFDLTTMLSYELEAQQRCWEGLETTEGLTACLENRDPDFTLNLDDTDS